MPWFVAATGRGTSLTAHVYGPYANASAFHQANPGFAGGTLALVGNQNGYPNRLAAQAEATKYNGESITQKATEAGGNTAKSLGLDPTNALGGLAAIGDFFNRLTQANTWLRVGEVVAGLLLVYLGLNATMRDTAVGRAVNSAKQGAKKTAMTIGAVAPK